MVSAEQGLQGHAGVRRAHEGLADQEGARRDGGREEHLVLIVVGRLRDLLPFLRLRVLLRGARFASGVGCNATATNLALLPLARAGLLDAAMPNTAVFADVLASWVPDAATRNRILVDNPTRLYWPENQGK